MLQGRAIQYLVILTLVQVIHSFDISISKTKDETIDSSGYYRNASYGISLFRTRYIKIIVSENDLRRFVSDNGTVIGYKFQIESTQPQVLNIRKVPTSTETLQTINPDTIIVDDLYISSRQGSLGRIFSVFPSPKLIRLNQTSLHGSKIHSMWSIQGAKMDLTNLTFRFDVFYDDGITLTQFQSLNVLVLQPTRLVDKIFQYFVPFVVITISTIMGLLLDPKIILSILQNPIPVLVGFAAQYGLMPFLAMGIGKIFNYTSLYSLALFVIGCCPGGGFSNQWTIIFDGDVNLSAIMSFVSTASSFVMMPLYFFTIGKIYMDELSIKIPFFDLLKSLALVIIPYAVSVTISYFFPKIRQIVDRFIKPLMICIVIFFLAFALTVNWYLFKMIDLYTALTAPCLPFLGFICGGILAHICGREWKHVKTIGIEAGIQNTGIAFMILLHSLPEPHATKATVVPMVVGLLTSAPFWVIYLVRTQVRKYLKRKKTAAKASMAENTTDSTEKSPLDNENNNKNADVVENMEKSSA